MPKPAVLMIGGVTHVKKEWEECSSFALLKVCSPYPLLISPGEINNKSGRNTLARQRQISYGIAKVGNGIM